MSIFTIVIFDSTFPFNSPIHLNVRRLMIRTIKRPYKQSISIIKSQMLRKFTFRLQNYVEYINTLYFNFVTVRLSGPLISWPSHLWMMASFYWTNSFLLIIDSYLVLWCYPVFCFRTIIHPLPFFPSKKVGDVFFLFLATAGDSKPAASYPNPFSNPAGQI